MAKLPLQANFYPMTSMAYIQDPGTRLTLLTAQSLGSASLVSGECKPGDLFSVVYWKGISTSILRER
jgi:hypothetical protein